MSDYKPLTCLPVLPLRGIVVFPGCVTHFDVGRSKSARAVEEAMRGDQMLELTNREFECLRELLQNQGRVMTYPMLVSRIWNYDYLGDDRVIYSHIKNLRRKLGADYIRTVRGVGYRVDKD